MKKTSVRRLVLAALFLVLGIYLPTVFHMVVGSLSQILSPMHLPVLLCGIVCGWQYGLGVGILTPILCSLLTGMPPFYPMAFAMAAELGTYGLVTGAFSNMLGKRMGRGDMKVVFPTLMAAMILGRLVYGFVKPALLGIFTTPYALILSVGSSLVKAWPALLLQILVIPALVLALDKARLLEKV